MCNFLNGQWVTFGGSPGIRDRNLLDSALARPKNQSEGSIPVLAAMYAVGIIEDHPFIDGNKRTALVTAELFLRLNGYKFSSAKEEKYLQYMLFSAGRTAESEFMQWFSLHVQVEMNPHQ